MKLLVLSDIHGNLEALNSVLASIADTKIDGYLLLGDLIDYGMHSNEVVKIMSELPFPGVVKIWGNHEDAIVNEHFEHFSTARGVESAKFIRESLSSTTLFYIEKEMNQSGKYEFSLGNKKCLAVHGSIKGEYWKSITPDVDVEDYVSFDFVFSGHSHVPHYFEKFVLVDNPMMRNKKKVVFINPGSVGQPRNHNNHAQYAIFDTVTEEICLKKVKYDILKEQNAYHGEVDDFYRNRLEFGI